jgi:hypothetical protein
MSTKTITMIFRNEEGGSGTITQFYDNDCAWPAIAHQFQNFLLSMGYRLDGEAVGSDVGEFVNATTNLDEEY